MDIDGSMYKIEMGVANEVQLPKEIMDYLKVCEGDKVDFELTAPGLIIVRKGEPL